MAEHTNPGEPRKLTDDELAEVSGGAYWDERREADYSYAYDRARAYGEVNKSVSFAEFLIGQGVDADSIRCRDEWLRLDKPHQHIFWDAESGFRSVRIQ